MLPFKMALLKTLSSPLIKNPRKFIILVPPKSTITMSSSSSWTFSSCTFINSNSLKPTSQFPSSSIPTLNLEKWSCKACTFLNPCKLSSCEICGTRNSSFWSDLNLADQELELGSKGVGNVFLPLLQKCSNGTINKRKTGDDSVYVDDLGKKAVEFVTVDDDAFDLGGSCDIKSAGKVLIGSGKVLIGSVDDDAFDLGGSCDIKSAGKALIGSDEARAKGDVRPLKILSYNVWFAENMELRIRMKAIGDIIQLHSPDVICLQEVTPDIYAIFQRTNWWKSYKCSLPFDKAITRPYFCMQLSKLHVKSFGCKQFSYSAMRRELCIAEISTQGDTPLVVATSHLESPCPGPPKWDQMYSKERVKQANEAVDFLKKYPNAILCGDMNWDDKLDGEFPLPDGWFDAWTELKPKEIGWTYDTKANPMLSANSKLQKRLDRCLVSLRDFKVGSINMVGTERIPEVTYIKQRKGKPDLELPVLPSDHFGLLLTLAAR